jgi:hypothetical protein
MTGPRRSFDDHQRPDSLSAEGLRGNDLRRTSTEAGKHAANTQFVPFPGECVVSVTFVADYPFRQMIDLIGAPFRTKLRTLM